MAVETNNKTRFIPELGSSRIVTAKTPAAPGTIQSQISERIASVGKELADNLRALLDQVPGQPQTSGQLASSLSVDKVLSHRVITALKKKDPIAIVHLLPGPVPLRRVVTAAGNLGVSTEITGPADESIQRFDRLIRQVGGDRAGLDAIVSAWLPEARAKFEAVAKQSIYRGARQIKGVAADVMLHTCFLYPSSPDSERSDAVGVNGYLGLRRIRPGADLRVGVQSIAVNMESGALTLDGHPATDLSGVILHEFCSEPPVELDVHSNDKDVVFGLRWGEAVGHTSARDIVLAEMRKNAFRRYRSADDKRARAGIEKAIVVPSRLYIGDLLLHEDVYPDWKPRVRVLETTELGVADPNDIRREFDVLDVLEHVELLGRGVECLRVSEVPNYVEMLLYVCNKRGWDPSKLRAYRTHIDYPVFGSQVQFVFDVPVR